MVTAMGMGMVMEKAKLEIEPMRRSFQFDAIRSCRR